MESVQGGIMFWIKYWMGRQDRCNILWNTKFHLYHQMLQSVGDGVAHMHSHMFTVVILCQQTLSFITEATSRWGKKKPQKLKITNDSTNDCRSISAIDFIPNIKLFVWWIYIHGNRIKWVVLKLIHFIFDFFLSGNWNKDGHQSEA